MNKSKLMLAVLMATAFALPAQASRKRAKTPEVREAGRVERPLSERYKARSAKKTAGTKVNQVLKGNGATYEKMVSSVSGVFQRARVSLNIPMSFRNAQGHGRSVNRLIVQDAIAVAKAEGKSKAEIAKIKKTYSGRTVLAMFREIARAEQALELARGLGANGKADVVLLEKAEAMYLEGIKLFEIAMNRYNQITTHGSKTRNDPSLEQLKTQLARFMSFGSARLREVLEESLAEGDVAALTGFKTRARQFAEATNTSSKKPMDDAFMNILREQGLEFESRNEMLKEVQRQKRLQKDNCG